MIPQPFQIGDFVELNPKHADNGGLISHGIRVITDVYVHPDRVNGRQGCESGWMVRVSELSHAVDSNWFVKV